MIRDITVGPNQKVKFDDDLTPTGCGDNYYYAVRAFDDHGNYSEVREEEYEVEVTEEVEVYETSTTSGAVPVPISAEGEEGGETAGDETEVGPEGQEGATVNEEGAQSGDETVAGAETTAAKASEAVKNWKFWLVILILVAIGYWAYRKKKDGQSAGGSEGK